MSRPVSVMIVEDDELLRDVYSMILGLRGFEVRTAENGFEALEQLEAGEPDVILLDYFMPKLDGAGFLLKFDAARFSKVRIVVASNISDEAVLKDMLLLGAHHHVLKASLSPNDLVELVRKVTAGRDNPKA